MKNIVLGLLLLATGFPGLAASSEGLPATMAGEPLFHCVVVGPDAGVDRYVIQIRQVSPEHFSATEWLKPSRRPPFVTELGTGTISGDDVKTYGGIPRLDVIVEPWSGKRTTALIGKRFSDTREALCQVGAFGQM